MAATGSATGRRNGGRSPCWRRLRGITPRKLHRLCWSEGTATAASRRSVPGGRGATPTGHARPVDPTRHRRSERRVPASALPRPATPSIRPRSRSATTRRSRSSCAALASTFRAIRVAIVGARQLFFARRGDRPRPRSAARERGRRVVSGAAYGIDAARIGARWMPAVPRSRSWVPGSTWAIHDRAPACIARIARPGTVVSEYAPGVPAEPHRFPARNRIVARCASALVVVEGAAMSGSRISVDHALDLGREVFAVPGPVTSPLAEVPLALIRDGATMIRGADDLLARSRCRRRIRGGTSGAADRAPGRRASRLGVPRRALAPRRRGSATPSSPSPMRSPR